MTNEEYLNNQGTLIRISTLLQNVDFEGFLQRINTAQTLGPLTDPTLYIRGGGRLQLLKDFATALAPTKQISMPLVQSINMQGDL